MKKLIFRVCICVVLLSVSACGFHLRGHNLTQAEFQFKSLYLKVAGESPFVSDLRHYLRLNKLTLVEDSSAADLILEIASERTDKQILSLTSAGRVQEFQLRYAVLFRAFDGKGQEWLPAAEIIIYRTMTYDDTQVLAKEQEEQMLYRDMRMDAIQQVLRRLGRAKPIAIQP